MNLREALGSALASLAARKLRSALTMLGMIFGVGAVISMMAIGAGAEREALALIERLGVDNVLVRSKELSREELEEVRQKSPGLSGRDAIAIQDSVPGVERVSPRVEIEPWSILASGGTTEGQVYGVSRGYRELVGLELAAGRFLDALDEASHAQVAVIGPALGRELFGWKEPLGELVKVNDVWLEVVGVLQSGGAGADSFQGVPVGSVGRDLYLPVTTASRKFDRDPLQSPLEELVVRLQEGSPARETAASIHALLQRLHGGADDFQLVVPDLLLEQSRRTQRLFSLVMGAIAGISLLVGGIGIMNIMLATVLERTREIGIRRTVGARRRDILTQFLFEAFAISLIGGLAGIFLGATIAWGVAAVAGWSTLVEPGAVLLAVLVAMAVGLASGYYPARRAADLDPIEAVRYE